MSALLGLLETLKTDLEPGTKQDLLGTWTLWDGNRYRVQDPEESCGRSLRLKVRSSGLTTAKYQTPGGYL